MDTVKILLLNIFNQISESFYLFIFSNEFLFLNIEIIKY